MKKFNYLIVCVFGSITCNVISQTSMLAEYKAMPAFPPGAKEAFKASKINVNDGVYFYEAASEPVTAYNNKLQVDNKPNQDIIMAKSTAGNAPAAGIVADFSDLNSPEMQAKIANMSQEEKIKFATEIQARMAANKNVQAANALTKPSPLSAILIKLGASSQKLLAVMPEFSKSPSPGFDKCAIVCASDNDPVCAAKIKACYSKISTDFHTAEITKFDALLKNTTAQYALKKAAFENDLKEFDALAAKYKREEIAADNSTVISLIMGVSSRIAYYEQTGAHIMLEAKNDTYCKNGF